MNSTTIETSRLLIRPYTLNDIDDAHAMNLDKDITKYTGDGGVVSKEEIKRRITIDVLGDYNKYGFGRMAVIHKSHNKYIGFCGLKYLEDLKEVDLGFRFLKEYWNKGIATEAGKACIDYGFNHLKLDKIIAMVLPENKASIRVLEKLNFKYERMICEEGLTAKLYTLTNHDHDKS